jgi:4-amino-4-deoxy-L-arabinose transferase-like glycosyltransferase
MSAAPASASDLPDRRWKFALLAVTLLAAVLRLVRLRYVPQDEYYDAAVRSMTLSLHNFLYGAFEPGGSASIDKPPLDLWLQVISVKLLGYGPTTLKLPEALSGAAAVPLLYDLVRRVCGRCAGLAAATVLALLPLSVVTSRSDTMDSVMMALLVATAWLALRAAQREQQRWLLAAAAVLGLAFNVKLFEALVPLPALVLFVWLCWRGVPLRTRVLRLAGAGAVFVAVACAWLVVVSLTPTHDRPYPIGSTNGSVWNAVFVYNGVDRLIKAPQHTTFPATSSSQPTASAAAAGATTPGPAPPAATVSHAGPLRLFAHNAIDYGGLIGTALFAALLLGALALLPAARKRLRLDHGAATQAVIARSALLAIASWLLIGYALFSFAGRVHPRYLEAFTPAVAVALGVSMVVLGRRSRLPPSRFILPLALLACVIESAAGSGSLRRAGLYLVALIGIAAVLSALGLLRRSGHAPRLPQWATPAAVASVLLTAVLALVLLNDDLRLIAHDSGVQADAVTLPTSLVKPLSAFLLSHQDGAHYEAAISAPTLAAPLIIRGLRPVLLLTSVSARPLVTLAQLRRDATLGKVRYVFIHGACPTRRDPARPACSVAAVWTRRHSKDITAQLGIAAKSGLLYQLPNS